MSPRPHATGEFPNLSSWWSQRRQTWGKVPWPTWGWEERTSAALRWFTVAESCGSVSGRCSFSSRERYRRAKRGICDISELATREQGQTKTTRKITKPGWEIPEDVSGRQYGSGPEVFLPYKIDSWTTFLHLDEGIREENSELTELKSKLRRYRSD